MSVGKFPNRPVMIAEAGAGILIYEQQEGRGIGLMAKLQAYELQDVGLDTVEANERLGFKADQREFGLPAEILKARKRAGREEQSVGGADDEDDPA